MEFYIDTKLPGKTVGTSNGSLSDIATQTGEFWFAALNNSGASSQFMNGPMDEIRIYDSVLSSDWIETEYNNQNGPSEFMCFSSEETSPARRVLLAD